MRSFSGSHDPLDDLPSCGPGEPVQSFSTDHDYPADVGLLPTSSEVLHHYAPRTSISIRKLSHDGRGSVGGTTAALFGRLIIFHSVWRVGAVRPPVSAFFCFVFVQS